MHPSTSLTEIAIVVFAALMCGLLATRLKQPPVIGYVLAGILLGPAVLSLVENREAIYLLAELGVLLLLFLIGMHLNLRLFREAWFIIVSTVLLQISACCLVMLGASYFFDWSFAQALLIGSITALSSTAVAVKLLEGFGELHSSTGRLTIGILIGQDLAFVPLLLLIRSMGTGHFDVLDILKIILSIGLLTLLIIYLSRKERFTIPYLSHFSSHTDLVPLIGLAFCFGAAALSGLAGLSAAYGPFIAGLILGNTAERHEVVRNTSPIQATLLMVFFLSVGLLLDVQYLWDNLLKVLFLLFTLFVCKTALNATILRILNQPLSTAFLSSLTLSQIGEFSFILSSVGIELNLLDISYRKLVIAVTVLSLCFSPIWLAIGNRIKKFGHTSLEDYVGRVNMRIVLKKTAANFYKRLKYYVTHFRKKI